MAVMPPGYIISSMTPKYLVKKTNTSRDQLKLRPRSTGYYSKIVERPLPTTSGNKRQCTYHVSNININWLSWSPITAGD